MVSLLQRVTFSKRRKGNPKGFAPAYGTSLRLSVPSLRCPSGGIASGLLRCTSSRWMRLRRMALRAFPLMDTYARPAEGAEDQKPHQKPEPEPEPKQIKRSQPSAVPTWDWVYSVGDWSAVRPPSRASPLPQLGRVHPQEIGRLSGRHRQQADSYNLESVHPMRRSRPTQHNER
jgi:hypothetical protein